MSAATADADEQESKDRFFERLAEIAARWTAAHGKDFAMGALVLAARWLAENKASALERAPRRNDHSGSGAEPNWLRARSQRTARGRRFAGPRRD